MFPRKFLGKLKIEKIEYVHNISAVRSRKYSCLNIKKIDTYKIKTPKNSENTETWLGTASLRKSMRVF